MPNSLDAVSLAALCHEDVELPERSLRAVRWVPCASAQDACGLIRWSRVGERPQPAMCELDGARGWVCDGAACAAARHREPALSYLPPRPEGAHVSEVESHRLNISLWGTVAPVFSKNLCSWLTHRLHVACRARVPQSACPTEARALIRVRVPLEVSTCTVGVRTCAPEVSTRLPEVRTFSAFSEAYDVWKACAAWNIRRYRDW